MNNSDVALGGGLAELRGIAEAACENAVAPYSEFRVGAALRTVAGGVFGGCNVETANYTLGLCAERVALVTAACAEGPHMRIAEVVVVISTGQPVAPCGACRQMLYEFGPDCTVTLLGKAGTVTHSIGELLPHPFGAEDLRKA